MKETNRMQKKELLQIDDFAELATIFIDLTPERRKEIIDFARTFYTSHTLVSHSDIGDQVDSK